jgi:hypothetical protein
MFKESVTGILPEDILAYGDSGYQGIHEYLPNAVIPFKAAKKQTSDQKTNSL